MTCKQMKSFDIIPALKRMI